ncbi:MAG: hypothetical protein R2867_47575 [Caldilineaceae bacterium]
MTRAPPVKLAPHKRQRQTAGQRANRIERADQRATDAQVTDELLNKDRDRKGSGGTGHNRGDGGNDDDDPAIVDRAAVDECAGRMGGGCTVMLWN